MKGNEDKKVKRYSDRKTVDAKSQKKQNKHAAAGVNFNSNGVNALHPF